MLEKLMTLQSLVNEETDHIQVTLEGNYLTFRSEETGRVIWFSLDEGEPKEGNNA